MKNIFEYTNFREYLADFFEESKKSDPLFSHRYLASRLGLSTPNLIWLIIKGKRNLTRSVCDRLVKLLRLTKRRANYFRAMVDFLQAKKHEPAALYLPAPSEVSERLMPVSELVTVTAAPGITAPLSSCTTPSMAPDGVCARSAPPANVHAITSATQK